MVHPGDGARAVVVQLDCGVEVVIGYLVVACPDLVLVEALARLQLAARRLGTSIHLRDAPPELRELLDLVGLADLIVGPRQLPLEVGRQPEGGEQLGVEEIVEPGDATA